MADDSPDPVFILAPPRSFTSLVSAVIGQHPALYGMPELNLFQCATIAEFNSGRNADGSVKSPFWRVMRDGLLRAVAQLYGGEQTIESVEMAENWLAAREDRTSGEVYRELCRKVAPLRIVEKSPAYLRSETTLARLRETFPDARYVHLLRHPRGQCESLLKARGGALVLFLANGIDHSGEEPVLDPQIAWHDLNVLALNFLSDLPSSHWIQLRGEDFLNNLDAELEKFCRWLGISDDKESIELMKHPEDSEYSSIGPANARLGNDVNFLNSPMLRTGKVVVPTLVGPLPWRSDGRSFHPDVVALAREFGYS